MAMKFRSPELGSSGAAKWSTSHGTQWSQQHQMSKIHSSSFGLCSTKWELRKVNTERSTIFSKYCDGALIAFFRAFGPPTILLVKGALAYVISLLQSSKPTKYFSANICCSHCDHLESKYGKIICSWVLPSESC